MVLLPGAASTSRRRNRLKGIKMDGDELRDIYSGIQETPYFMGFFELSPQTSRPSASLVVSTLRDTASYNEGLELSVSALFTAGSVM